MPLTRATAAKIIQIVKADPVASSRIKSLFSEVIPDSWGWTGSIRNISMIFEDPTDPAVSNLVCVGISDAASLAIDAALKQAPGIPEVVSSESLNRTVHKVEHTATLVNMKDSSAFVFDWHATLNIDNPMISAKSDWLQGINAILFSDFPKNYLR